MLKISEESKRFLESNCPSVLKAETISEALDLLYVDIDEKGFGGKKFDEYNDYGRAAQKVYDDIYYNGTIE